MLYKELFLSEGLQFFHDSIHILFETRSDDFGHKLPMVLKYVILHEVLFICSILMSKKVHVLQAVEFTVKETLGLGRAVIIFYHIHLLNSVLSQYIWNMAATICYHFLASVLYLALCLMEFKWTNLLFSMQIAIKCQWMFFMLMMLKRNYSFFSSSQLHQK